MYMASDSPDPGTQTAEHRTDEWNAAVYHRVSEPQVSWGERVLARVRLRGDETVLDAGCGTGRLTAHLLEQLPHGKVIAVDRSANMLQVAAEHLTPRFGDRVTFVQADLAHLDLSEVADVIFSTATFHWVLDHDLLFRTLHRVLKPGGRLVAQCGGGRVLEHLLHRASLLMASPPFAPYFVGWGKQWEFADADTTARRLKEAGFVEVKTWLQQAPVTLDGPEEYAEYVRTVVFRLHLERIGDESLGARFIDELTRAAAGDDPPYSLDYWRLNLEAIRPG
jgi:trans-aconitate 2-methyltransferase